MGKRYLQAQTKCSDLFLEEIEFLGFNLATDQYAFRFPVMMVEIEYIVYLLITKREQDIRPTMQAFDGFGRDTYAVDLINYLLIKLDDCDIIEESAGITESDFITRLNHAMNTKYSPYFRI